MSDIETLKAEIKKLSAKSVNAKMNLHDLSEDLPTNWQSILEVAQETYNTFKTLEDARKKLKELEAGAAA
ncbi:MULTISPECIES: CCE_0567 family metalloprotein [Azorhizobium]|uniref:UPF0437 protein AZC_3451 n=1 Tax=Azorhizobium caulinodans (strain ATCC 43989 / DSM 5975 / JCM 20966 / LMG 6465 / NBRC 14845 / NCIMB 13405 / ORS 571) TaxID=438753 RepID=Y3451_AZOC5|nr:MULTISPECIES: CCE_0567 family metalloprotein [Azorhizobium]P26486.1 RecName: Full=UPF0437 protein AZC_3451; AltName: Full=ORF1 [Azorhizobium caulinodans ORS 571]TDU01221.1 hypothetical protein DFO45_0738 [Azorhizobium sp. AG788]BAF89449.1 hypothetical 7.7 kDa protein in fixX 3'region [Azorhizobium caulinodans ORS 571]CAA39095.1 unnamed protein product [Azorhizobium caulinodans ORS 571]